MAGGRAGLRRIIGIAPRIPRTEGRRNGRATLEADPTPGKKEYQQRDAKDPLQGPYRLPGLRTAERLRAAGGRGAPARVTSPQCTGAGA